jgi:PAS domain S-box-containing protein
MNNVTLAQDKNTPPVEDGVQRTTVSTLKIVLAYASFASLWILLSDKAVEWLLNDPATITLVSMLKGWFFVAVTSVLLYGLIKQQVDQVLKAHLRELDAHKEKARAKQLLDNIANSSPDAIFAKDLQGRYLLYNRETARIVGKPADQALGCDDTALFPAEQARDASCERPARDRREPDQGLRRNIGHGGWRTHLSGYQGAIDR